jgi:hypothetical protein
VLQLLALINNGGSRVLFFSFFSFLFFLTSTSGPVRNRKSLATKTKQSKKNYWPSFTKDCLHKRKVLKRSESDATDHPKACLWLLAWNSQNLTVDYLGLEDVAPLDSSLLEKINKAARTLGELKDKVTTLRYDICGYPSLPAG